MEKIKVGIVYGGVSTEHEVSIKSAIAVMNNLDKNKYEIYQIYIAKNNVWQKGVEKEKIENIIEHIKKMDVIFPVLHGLNGEDGTIQGMLKLFNIPFVGCGILASSVGMDKVYTKIIFDKVGIKQAKYTYIRAYKDKYIYVDTNFNESILSIDEVVKKVENNLKYPMFVKPSNSGSSVGINKVKTTEDLVKAIIYAAKFDSKIVIEEGLVGRELECAVMGNEEVMASSIGEILSEEEFYSYDAKYINGNTKTIIPKDISKETISKIQELAIKAFKAINGKGLSRVDFFLDEQNNDVYINEINTLPGFTNISMYPQLFNDMGISYPELLENIIKYALENK